jgi:hypothetical protein
MRNFSIKYGERVIVKNGLLLVINMIVAWTVLFLDACGWLPNWWYTMMRMI